MRNAQLIRERMEPILNGQEAITEVDLVEDWRLSLQEMASCGFDVSELMMQLEIYKAARKRFVPERQK